MTCNPVSSLTCGVAVTFLSYVSISIWEISRIKMITPPLWEADGPAGVHQGVFVPRHLKLVIHNTRWERWCVHLKHINTEKIKKKKKGGRWGLERNKKPFLCLTVSFCAPLLEQLKLSIITQLPQYNHKRDNIFNLLCGWQICIVACYSTVALQHCNAAFPA